MQTKAFIAAALVAGAAPALAHMDMKFPQPLLFAQHSGDYTSPIVRSQFPCKGYLSQVTLGQGDGAAQTTWSPGESANFTITGGAFHGGGSCQASLSYDGGKTFTVVHSYIGSCPASNGDTTLQFTVPSDAPAQNNVVFAWTWFNHIGNREMYMNCAVVDIGGSSKRSIEQTQVEKRATAFKDRPNMFVANLDGSTGCQTVEGFDVDFPQPGPDVDRKTTTPGDGANLFKDKSACSDPNNTGAGTPGPAGGSSSGSGSGSGSSSGSGSGNAATSAAAGTTAAGTTAAATYTSASKSGGTQTANPGGVFVTTQPGSSATTSATTGAAAEPTNTGTAAAPTTLVTSTTVAATSATTPAASATTTGGSATPTGGASSGAFAAGTPCTNEGAWNCINGSSFQRCASGMWSAPMQMAAGTTCTAGISDNLVMFRKRGGPRIMAGL